MILLQEHVLVDICHLDEVCVCDGQDYEFCHFPAPQDDHD